MVIPIPTPLQGMAVDILVAVGDAVQKGQPVAVIEALKMEHVIASPGGDRQRYTLTSGDTILDNTPTMFMNPLGCDDTN